MASLNRPLTVEEINRARQQLEIAHEKNKRRWDAFSWWDAETNTVMSAITQFRGANRFLSNFYLCDIVWVGHTYPSLEHAYQASKTLDPVERLLIKREPDPAKAKAIGGDRLQITLRKDWHKLKLEFMERMLRQKFETDPLRLLLRETGTATLVEGNRYHGNFWGICLCNTCNDAGYVGLNHLGRLLMLIRSELE